MTEESVKVGNNTADTYAYEYDDYGNRVQMTASGTEDYVTEYSYNNSQGKYTALLQNETKTVEGEDNALLPKQSNVEKTTYTYDANGNQITKKTSEKTETNTYDGLNQLIGFKDGETTVSYTYDVNGLRLSKTVDGVTTKHVWDGNKQIVADVVNGQYYEADCYLRGTNLVATYSYCNGAKTDYTYYTQNAHGDVVNLTDADGAVVKSYTYDAFGVEKNIDNSDANAFRYCGEYYDAETGTIYLRARYYNPNTGRFISRDSNSGKSEEPLSLNLYTYCHNNPIIYIDSSGCTIQLAGTAEEQGAILSEMQKLTDHTLDYDKNGYVYIAQNAYDNPIFGNVSTPGGNSYFGIDLFSQMYHCKKYNNIKYMQGNMLIERMINSQKNCNITVDYGYDGGRTDYVSSKNCSNGKGTNTSITFNPDFSPNLYTGKTVNSLLSLQKTDPYIVLAHEMIHADRAMQGITLTGKTSHKYLISYISHSLFSNETYGYESIKKKKQLQ